MQYRCYFVNLHASIERAEIIDADCDADALARADTMFRAEGAGFSRVEVWDRARRVAPPFDNGTAIPPAQFAVGG